MRTTQVTGITKIAAFLVGTLCVLGVLDRPVLAQFQMPDPRQMAGIPRPVDDLPAGSVSVRLIRGQRRTTSPIIRSSCMSATR